MNYLYGYESISVEDHGTTYPSKANLRICPAPIPALVLVYIANPKLEGRRE